MTYVPKRTPRAKQQEALDAIDGKRAFSLAMWMRVGKTGVVINHFGRLVEAGQASDLCVIAPAGAYLPWVDEFSKDLDDEISKQTKIFVWISGKAGSKTAQRERKFFLDHPGPRVLLMNVEAISAVEKARNFVREFLGQRPGKRMVAIDESVCIKNPESNCGAFVAKEVRTLADWRVISSGLLSPRSPLDVYNQFYFLDPAILGYDRFTTFRARYANVKPVCMLPNKVIRAKFVQCLGKFEMLTDFEMRKKMMAVWPDLKYEVAAKMPRSRMIAALAAAAEGAPRDLMVESISRLGGYIMSVPVIDGYQNVEELRDKIAPHQFRCLLEDCYDLPESDWSFRDVEMTDEQRKIYKELKEFATAELASKDHVTANHVVTQMLRLHQVLCGHVKDEDGKEHEIREWRTADLIELLDDYEGKAAIWCSYDFNVRKVSEALKKEFGDDSTSRFWGGNVATREEEEREFKENPRRRFMVGTPDAGGKGRDWSVADLVCYYSSRNNLDHRIQSEERVKAVGKTRPIAYVDFRVKGTVEDKIVNALRAKMDLAATIHGDAWREWLV